MSQRIKNLLLYSIIFLLIVLVGVSFDKNSIIYQFGKMIIAMIFLFPVSWVIPLSLFHIFYHKKSSKWHLIFSELFLLVCLAVEYIIIFRTHITSVDTMFILIFIPVSLVSLLLNPIVQLIISYFKKKKFHSMYTPEEGLMSRVINTENKK